jgi:hypothetical protein
MPDDTITAGTAPARRDRLATVDVDGELVVLDEDSGAVHLLNPTASIVFQCLDGTSTLREIAGDFADELGAPLDVVEADLVRLAIDLAAHGLLAS